MYVHKYIFVPSIYLSIFGKYLREKKIFWRGKKLCYILYIFVRSVFFFMLRKACLAISSKLSFVIDQLPRENRKSVETYKWIAIGFHWLSNYLCERATYTSVVLFIFLVRTRQINPRVDSNTCIISVYTFFVCNFGVNFSPGTARFVE